MKSITVATDIIPIGEFKAKMSKWLSNAKETGHPVVITQNGRPAAVMLSPEEYDRLQHTKMFFDSVVRGLSDAESGNVMDTDQLREEIKKHRSQHVK